MVGVTAGFHKVNFNTSTITLYVIYYNKQRIKCINNDSPNNNES